MAAAIKREEDQHEDYIVNNEREKIVFLALIFWIMTSLTAFI